MATPRRNKIMSTEGQATKFLYTVLKQLDLKTVRPHLRVSFLRWKLLLTPMGIFQIDWNLVATELDISNGHAARMRYSRFKQQMESTITAPKSVKPKKSNGRTDSGKASAAAKSTTKGKYASDKSGKGSANTCSGGKAGNSKSGGTGDGNTKKRSAPDDFTKQETVNHGAIPSIESNNPMTDCNSMSDPFASGMPYFVPPNGSAFNCDTAFPFMPMQPPFPSQHQLSDPSTNFSLAPEDPMCNPAFAPDGYDAFDNFNNNDNFPGHHTDFSGWNNQTEFCFSGCCQPHNPPTPRLFPNFPLEDADFPSLGESEPLVLESSCHTQQPQKLWVPIKSEPGCEDNSDDILVKVEAEDGA